MDRFSRRTHLQRAVAAASGGWLAHRPGIGLAASQPSTPPPLLERSILEFGARSEEGHGNAESIQRAIDFCAEKGGGRVIVPPGSFLTGSVVLKSNVQLYLQKGAVLKSSPRLRDFPERPLRQQARYQQYLKRALIYAQGEKNISVCGEGILDGNVLLDGSGEFREQSAENPTLLWFDECSNVTVRGITFRRSVWWTQAYSQCRHVHIDRITVMENYAHNADGCDFLDCEDFLMENCTIDANDDAICLKSYVPAGCLRGVIRNNKVRSLCNGIKMGTDSSGGFRHIIIENNEVWQTGISGIALQIVDGGIMENIAVRHTVMNGVGTPVQLRLGNRNRRMNGILTVPPGILRNIYIGGLRATVNKAEKYNDEERKRHNYQAYTSSICGIPGSRIEEVTLEDVEIRILGGFPPAGAEDSLREIPELGDKYPENRMFGTLPSFGFYIRHARKIRMNRIRIEHLQPDGRPAFLLDDVHDSAWEGVQVTGRNPTPCFSVLGNCTGVGLNV